jgi:hypothetical protein
VWLGRGWIHCDTGVVALHSVGIVIPLVARGLGFEGFILYILHIFNTGARSSPGTSIQWLSAGGGSPLQDARSPIIADQMQVRYQCGGSPGQDRRRPRGMLHLILASMEICGEGVADIMASWLFLRALLTNTFRRPHRT